MTSPPTTQFDLADLVAEFYQSLDSLGNVESLAASQMPEPFRSLLAHNHHMTVTVEQFHGSLVDVRVLQHKQHEPWYSREIVLVKSGTIQVVQYGIVRIKITRLTAAVRREIESEQKPLGRVLIEHGVMRQVKLGGLYRVIPNLRLAERMGILPESTNAESESVPNDSRLAMPTCYGRTAQIIVDGESAIDLFELLPPPRQPHDFAAGLIVGHQ